MSEEEFWARAFCAAFPFHMDTRHPCINGERKETTLSDRAKWTAASASAALDAFRVFKQTQEAQAGYRMAAKE